METFKFEIREILSRVVEVEADTVDDAYDVVKAMYKNEDIVLDAEDVVTTEIEEYSI